MDKNFSTNLADFFSDSKKKEEFETRYIEKKETMSENENNLKEKMAGIENKIKKTKFRKRVYYHLNNENKIVFLVDNAKNYEIDHDTFLIGLKENKEEFENKIVKELYNWENAYTLIDFVETMCHIEHENKLEPRFRTSVTNFIKEYVKYVENEFRADKIMNLKKVVKILNEKYGCKKIKFKNIDQLDRITLLDTYNEQCGKRYDCDKTSKIIFLQFVQEYFEVYDLVSPKERIKRSDFMKLYKAYLIDKVYTRFKLTNSEVKEILLNEYNENFIKTDGIYYMKKLKLKIF